MERVVLLLPKEKWMGKLQEYRALNIQKGWHGERNLDACGKERLAKQRTY